MPACSMVSDFETRLAGSCLHCPTIVQLMLLQWIGHHMDPWGHESVNTCLQVVLARRTKLRQLQGGMCCSSGMVCWRGCSWNAVSSAAVSQLGVKAS